MNRTRIVIIAVVGLAMTGSVFLYRSQQATAPVLVPPAQVADTMSNDTSDTSTGTTETGRMMAPRKQAPEQNPERFSGKLEQLLNVDVGLQIT